MSPTVATATRATASVLPDSTAWPCAASPCSEKDAAVRSSPGCESPPVCADAKPTAADRVAPGPESTTSETAPPPPASECGPHPACPSSACARNWPGSAPHPRSRSGVPVPAPAPQTTDCSPWPPCQLAPVQAPARNTSWRLRRRELTSAPRFPPSPYPTMQFAASWDENHIL